MLLLLLLLSHFGRVRPCATPESVKIPNGLKLAEGEFPLSHTLYSTTYILKILRKKKKKKKILTYCIAQGTILSTF